jgi:hypothetical protein
MKSTRLFNQWTKLPKRSQYAYLKVYFTKTEYYIVEIPKDCEKVKLEIINNKYSSDIEDEYLTNMAYQQIIKQENI